MMICILITYLKRPHFNCKIMKYFIENLNFDCKQTKNSETLLISTELKALKFNKLNLFVLKKKMHQIMLQVVHSIRYKIQRKVGYFGIYGYDFMIDENMKVWLIEINVNPAITTNTDTLIKAIPPAIEEGIQIAIECFEKSKANKKLLPLTAQKNYTMIFNETTAPQQRPTFDKSPTVAGIRRSMSNSPNQQSLVNNKSITITTTKTTPLQASTQLRNNSNIIK